MTENPEDREPFDDASAQIPPADPKDLPAGVLADVLSAIVLGVPERAHDVLVASEGPAEPLKAALLGVVDSGEAMGDIARRLGDVLRSRQRPLDPDVVECYRASFYLGDRWEELARNPLFARFSANKAGLPFDKWIQYFDIYARTLAPYVGKPVKVLEIGVFHGGGLEQLRALLGPEATLIGMDIDPAAKAACAGRFEVAVGDQTDPQFLAQMVADFGPFDIIIDDGGHTMAQQIISIENLFATLNEGGLYLVEDTHTSYWEPYQDADETFMEWAKARLDDINAYHFSGEQDLGVWTTSLTGIHIYDSVVVFEKSQHLPPFCEVVGTGSFVYSDRLSESALLGYRAALDTRVAESTLFAEESQDLIRRIQDRLDDADAQLATVHQRLAAADQRADDLDAERDAMQQERDQAVEKLEHTVSRRISRALREGTGKEDA